MRAIKIEKVTLNVAAGKDQDRLERALKLLKTLTGKDPVKTTTQKRIPEWGLRPGLPIGCKITLRKAFDEVLKKLLEAKENVLTKSHYDEQGSIAFGIHEYIDIPGMKYDPDIGSMGLQVCVTLQRPGYRLKYRKVQKKKIPQKHRISKEEAMQFMEEHYKTKGEAA